MASSNRSAYILANVKTALDTIAGVAVLNVFTDKAITGYTAYPFILNQNTIDFLEDGAGDTLGQCAVTVLFHKPVNQDTGNTGVGTDAYAELVEDVEDAIADLQLSAISGTLRETHTDGRFMTKITNVIIKGWDGYFDEKQTMVKTACSLMINYTHIAIA